MQRSNDVVEGEAFVRIAGEEAIVKEGACLLVPAGVEHYVRNDGHEPLFFLTVYAPPEY